ncbi:MAG TPA: flavin reductase family protein [Ktedonobacteraceae bacterium]|jgi:flavin reductase (DIM6/NTAB) family NADH-FMN oxidoreductase RutF
MAPDTDFFRKVMGHFATGVAIATTRGRGGVAGLTVNSFTSVSLNPLLVLICVDLHSQALPFFRESGVFAVNMLTREQEALSNGFATSSEERYQHFCHAAYSTAATGSPILEGVLAFIDARISAEYPGGDHTILLGEVQAMGYDQARFFLPGSIALAPGVRPEEAGQNGYHDPAGTHASPLVYYRGQYHHLSTHYQHDHPELKPVVETP